MTSAHYQPLGGGGSSSSSSDDLSFKLNFRKFALATVLLPFTGFLTCIVISLVLHMKESTATHCGVENVLPSISAAIGSLQPQRYIWRICIALHAAPRLLVGAMYHHRYVHRLMGNTNMQSQLRNENNPFRNIIIFNTILYIFENAALIGISYISSIENRKVHENCFITFTCSFLLYMVLSIGLSYSIENSNYEHEHRSNKAKVTLLLTNVTSLIIALYCFYRHNKYCEPYVYSFFALGEYIFVLSNMGFHMTAYWDFYNYEFNIGPEIFHKTR